MASLWPNLAGKLALLAVSCGAALANEKARVSNNWHRVKMADNIQSKNVHVKTYKHIVEQITKTHKRINVQTNRKRVRDPIASAGVSRVSSVSRVSRASQES